MSKNWICRMFGCKCDDDGYCCVRCGLYLYDMDAGILWPVRYRALSIKDALVQFWVLLRPWDYCSECGKVIRKNKEFCSEKCKDDWVPF